MEDFLTVNLGVDPQVRWSLPPERVDQLRDLADYYMGEMGVDAFLAKQIHEIAAP